MEDEMIVFLVKPYIYVPVDVEILWRGVGEG
jgi:hypothetical protein